MGIEERMILTPGEAAVRLGIEERTLVGVIRRGRHTFTELVPGGKPGDRGRGRWGLTGRQLDTILRGMERRLPEPQPKPTTALSSLVSPDGRSRLRRGRR
jgi:hypothetical protein